MHERESRRRATLGDAATQYAETRRRTTPHYAIPCKGVQKCFPHIPAYRPRRRRWRTWERRRPRGSTASSMGWLNGECRAEGGAVGVYCSRHWRHRRGTIFSNPLTTTGKWQYGQCAYSGFTGSFPLTPSVEFGMLNVESAGRNSPPGARYWASDPRPYLGPTISLSSRTPSCRPISMMSPDNGALVNSWSAKNASAGEESSMRSKSSSVWLSPRRCPAS